MSFVSGGYFLSKDTGELDCTGSRLRPVTLACDHSARVYLPDWWAVRWIAGSDDEPREAQRAFGFSDAELAEVVAWATEHFDTRFALSGAVYSLDDARWLRDRFCARAGVVDLWGVALPESLRDELLEAKRQLVSVAHALDRAERPDPSGRLLGFELLAVDVANTFNSPESRHYDEAGLLAAEGVTPNEHGLIPTLEEAERVCARARLLPPPDVATPWFPWRIAAYD